MLSPLIPANEVERLDELRNYKILDTLPEAIFDDLTLIASQICGTEIGLITLVDAHRQWFKSKVGIDATETPRDISFCGHVILGNSLFEVPNALEDERFSDNPLVIGDPNIRFYAAVPLINRRNFSLGTLCVIDQAPKTLSSGQRSALQALGRQVTLLIENRLNADEAEKTSRLLERTGEIAKVGGWQLELANMKLHWTREVFNIHELPPSKLPSIDEAINFYTSDTRPVIKRAVERTIADGTGWDMELPFITAKGRHLWVRTQGAAIVENGKTTKLLGAFQDITERKKTQLDLAWLNRALFMLSKCNEAIINITNEFSLLTEICRIAVVAGGYRLAWVGYANDDQKKSIVPKAYYGESRQFIDAIHLSWSEELLEGKGPGGKTIREGEAIFVKDMMLDPSYPFKDQVAEYGYHGLACLPLKIRNKTFGLLALYSAEARTFADDEVKLLQELSNNLTASIINIRTERERRRLRDALLTVATAVSLHSDDSFFPKILTNLISALGGQAGYIAQFITTTPWSAKTIAVEVGGVLASNYDYKIPDVLVEELFSSSDLKIVPDSADKLFPNLSMMRFYQYQAFAALRLIDFHGQPIGLLFVLFENPLPQESIVLIESLLKIFAARTAGEIERLRSVEIISEQASLLDKTQDAIVVRDLQHNITYWNKAAEDLYGWTTHEAVGKNIQKLLKHPLIDFRRAEKSLLKDGEWSGEMPQKHKDGRSLAIESHWTLVNDNNGKPKSIFSIKTDISDRKNAEQEIKQLAFYDALTLLPNRRLLLDRLETALKLVRRRNNFGALFFIDLDNFKTLNDSLGHDKGDILLKEVAYRLQQCVRTTDTVARLGGDEFVVMLEGLSSTHHQAVEIAISVAVKIISEVGKPVAFDGYQHVSTPSIGIALFSQETASIEELLMAADAAMYQSKFAGRNRYTVYSAPKKSQAG